MKRSLILLPCLVLVALLAQPLVHSAAAPNATLTETVFDFIANTAYAQWRSGAGVLPFPGTSGDYRGYAQLVAAATLEDGTTDTAIELLSVPQLKYNGYIQGTYPAFTVLKNDRFQTTVGCEPGATKCYVTFRLDYTLTDGTSKVFWQWKEKNDGKVYKVDIDLSALAGKKVKFTLTLLATGDPEGDRALWSAPRIVRPGDGIVPLPSLTPTTAPFATPPPVTGNDCDKAAFVADITIPDGASFTPGAAFTKGWRLKNVGGCAWTTDYTLVFYNGEQMGGPTSVKMPWRVEVGETVEIAVNLVAPTTPGPHRGNWILQRPPGKLFGVGANGTTPIWVQINVIGTAPSVTSGYDFVASACTAQWKSGAGALGCPGTEGDAKGFVLIQSAPKLEDGTTSSSSALLTMPQNKWDGYLQGAYPTFTVQPGDRFQATIGCEAGANCYVTYRLDYLTPGGMTKIFWQWKEKNEGRTYNVNVDLTPLAGKSVRFMLTMLATGSPNGDRALWVAPRIVRTQSGGVVTPVPTPPYTYNWLTYTNAANGFQFKYPPDAALSDSIDTGAHFDFSIIPGTNLSHKYMDVTVRQNDGRCESPIVTSMGGTSQHVVIGGVDWKRGVGEEGGMNQLHKWIDYSTAHNNICLSLTFILHSVSLGAYATPPAAYDEAVETYFINELMKTFLWLDSSTPQPSGPYAPVLVAANDVLNIYTGAANAPIVGFFNSNERNIRRTGPSTTVDGREWVEVTRPDGGTGWVESNYIVEYVTSEYVAGDERVNQLIAKLKQAMNGSDGNLFASLVSPKHGLSIRYHGNGGPTVVWTPAQVQAAFTSGESIDWGPNGASGMDISGTFAQIIQPKWLDVLNATYEMHLNDSQGSSMYPTPWPGIYQNLNFYSVWKPASPDVVFDWREWLVGIEYINGKPYIVAMLHYVWEP